MVNSKKMSKSTVAIVILSLLLVLSLILTATGAWFTSKTDATGNATINFGEVKVSDGAATITANKEGGLYVPGDSFTAEVSFKNGSTVEMYYIYDVTAKVYTDSTKGTELATGLVEITGQDSATTATKLAVGANAEKQTITFNLLNDKEDNTLNGKAGVYVEVTIKVYAVQAEHFTPEQALEKLNAMKTTV